MIALIILLPIWFVFGWFAARMSILERKYIKRHDGVHVDPSIFMILGCLSGGTFAWFGYMITSIRPNIRREAHFIPTGKPGFVNYRIVERLFGIKPKSD